MSGSDLVFIVGAPRSGTTWLQLLLSQSDDVCTCNETHLFSCYLSSLFHSWDGFKNNSRSIGLHHVVDERIYFAAIKDFAERIFHEIRAASPTATMCLEKTPAHALCWRSILRIFPESRFIHIIRDPRAVVASLSSAGRGWGRAWAGPGIVENAELWVSHVSSARQIRTATTNHLEVRYENLWSETADEIHKVFAWLGTPVSIAEAKRYADACGIEVLRQGGCGLETTWSLEGEPAGFFGSGGAEAWKPKMGRRQIAVIQQIAGELMDELGYERERTPWLPPVQPLAHDIMVKIGSDMRYIASKL